MNIDGKTLDIKQDNLETLRKLFPSIFSEGKVDLEKFKALFYDDIYFNNERYTLNWAGKSDAFKILQERVSATLTPQPELSVNFNGVNNVCPDHFEENREDYEIRFCEKCKEGFMIEWLFRKNELIIALTEMNLEIAAAIVAMQPKPQKVITLDRLFSGNDELKTNTALQMRDAGVEFRTI